MSSPKPSLLVVQWPNGLQRVQLDCVGRCLKDPRAYVLEVSYSAEQGRPNKLKPVSCGHLSLAWSQSFSVL